MQTGRRSGAGSRFEMHPPPRFEEVDMTTVPVTFTNPGTQAPRHPGTPPGKHPPTHPPTRFEEVDMTPLRWLLSRLISVIFMLATLLTLPLLLSTSPP